MCVENLIRWFKLLSVVSFNSVCLHWMFKTISYVVGYDNLELFLSPNVFKILFYVSSTLWQRKECVRPCICSRSSACVRVCVRERGRERERNGADLAWFGGICLLSCLSLRRKQIGKKCEAPHYKWQLSCSFNILIELLVF